MISKGVFSVGKGALLPQDERAREIMPKLKTGDRVLVTIHRARNPEFNALAHSVFNKIADAKGVPMDTIKLWLKWETGRVDLVQLVDGKRVAVPRSFAFESMSEDEFQEFWKDALPIIGEKILPQMPKNVNNEIVRIISGRT